MIVNTAIIFSEADDRRRVGELDGIARKITSMRITRSAKRNTRTSISVYAEVLWTVRSRLHRGSPDFCQSTLILKHFFRFTMFAHFFCTAPEVL